MIDDPIDGDSPIKLSAEERVCFLHERLHNFETEKWDKKCAADMLCESALKDAETIGIKDQLKKGLSQVLESMKFDTERISDFLKTGERKFPPSEQLEKHYSELDTEGTVLGMLAILDETISRKETKTKTAMLSRAVRIFYDIRDLKKEVLQGLVNISKEEAENFEIDMEELVAFSRSDLPLKKAPASIKNWLVSKSQEAQTLLEASRGIWEAGGEYKPLTKEILRVQYYKGSKSFLDNLQQKLQGCDIQN